MKCISLIYIIAVRANFVLMKETEQVGESSALLFTNELDGVES